MPVYIYQLADWPRFTWDYESLIPLLSDMRYPHGQLMGRMKSLGFQVRSEATLEFLTADVVKSGEIDGEILDAAQVHSSISRRLGLPVAGLVPADRHVEGVVEMMLDATQDFRQPLTAERLFGWHAALFPTGRSGMHKIVVGAWRNNTRDDPMQVVSGPMNREIVHFRVPYAELIDAEIKAFLDWFEAEQQLDAVLKAAIAHFWFVTIHPFDDGNGRISRAIIDLQLCRADKSQQRFYTMLSQIRMERSAYHHMLETTQKNSLNVTEWLI